MKSILIMGASSGIGKACAKIFIEKGYTVGIAARRKEKLEELQQLAPTRVFAKAIDITTANAANQINELIEEMGGIDIYFHVSGIGKVNPELEPTIELETVRTNGEGWMRCIVNAYNYLKQRKGEGQIAVISSVAGTKGLGPGPAYSATKRMQNTYIQALAQKAHTDDVNISFTDIRPGFVKTDLLDDGNDYPMILELDYTAQIICNAIEKKKRVKIVDWKYSLLIFVWRMIPDFIWEKIKLKVGKK